MKNSKVARGVWVTWLAISVFALGASAQQPSTFPKTEERQPPPAVGDQTSSAASGQNVVLRIGSSQVTQAEMDALISNLGVKAKAMVAKQGRGAVGDEYIKMILLSRRALDEHLDASPDLRLQLEVQRAETLAQAEYQKLTSEVKVTQEEVNGYYSTHQSEFETIQVRQFLIRKRPPGIEDPKQGLPIAEARTTAEAIRKALLAGTDVDQVAETYSTSISVMLVDGKPRTLRRAEMKPALEQATFVVPDGGVSEVVDMPQAFMVVKVLAHQRPELKDVAAEIEAKLQREKLDAEIDSMKKKADIWMDEAYFKETAPANSAGIMQPPSAKPHSQTQ